MTDLDDLAAPNCPDHLMPLEVVGEGATVRWECPEAGCSHVRIA